MQQDTFSPDQDYEQVKFHKKSRLFIVARSVRDGKFTVYLQLA